MALLRKTIQRQVIDSLDSSVFTSEDFDIIFGDPEFDQNLITLTFKHDQRYKYLVSKTGSSYVLFVSPGSIEDTDSSIQQNLHVLIHNIPSWCREIKEELKAAIPIFREMEELKSTLYEHLKGQSESEEFNAAEINELKQKFDALNKRVDELEKNNVITESQSAEFKEGIVKVTTDLEYYPKETWLKTAANKITRLIANLGKSPEGRSIMADTARKVLGLD